MDNLNVPMGGKPSAPSAKIREQRSTDMKAIEYKTTDTVIAHQPAGASSLFGRLNIIRPYAQRTETTFEQSTSPSSASPPLKTQPTGSNFTSINMEEFEANRANLATSASTSEHVSVKDSGFATASTAEFCAANMPQFPGSNFTAVNKYEVEAKPSNLAVSVSTSKQVSLHGRYSAITRVDRAPPAQVHVGEPPSSSTSERLFSVFELTENILLHGFSLVEILRLRQVSHGFDNIINNSEKLSRIIFLTPILKDIEGAPAARESRPRMGCCIVYRPAFPSPSSRTLSTFPSDIKLVHLNPFVFGPINKFSVIGTVVFSERFQEYVNNEQSAHHKTIDEMYITNPPVETLRVRIFPTKDGRRLRDRGRTTLNPSIRVAGGVRYKDLVAGIRLQLKKVGESAAQTMVLQAEANLPSGYEAVDEEF